MITDHRARYMFSAMSLGIRRNRHKTQRRWISFDPSPQPDRSERAHQQSPESACLCGALPEHAHQHHAEQRRNEEAEKRLHVVHDAGGAHHQVRGADGDDDAENRGPSSH